MFYWWVVFQKYCGQNISSFLCSFMGFHRITVICLKMATSFKKSRDCSTISIITPKSFNNVVDRNMSSPLNIFCVLLGHMSFHRKTADCRIIATSLKAKPDAFQFCPFITPLFPILGCGNMRYYAMRSNSSVSVKMKCDGALIQSIN